MPVIVVYGPVAAMDKEKRKEYVKLVTEDSVKVTGIPAAEWTVLLQGSSPETAAVGGVLLSEKAKH